MEAVNPLAASLESWSRAGWQDGVQVDDLDELDAIIVRTQRSVYELIVLSCATGDVLIRGGRHFPRFTPVRVVGSSGWGTFLKRLGIYRGLRLELLMEDRRILTSPVESAEVQSSALSA